MYLLRNRTRTVYLNPDLIASGIAPRDFEKASFHAGRLLITEIKARIALDESFCFESTLSGRTWLALLKGAIDQGYQVTVYFLYLDSIKKNLQRIKKRVLLGGHPIPTDAVYRRHPRCFSNFWNLYRPLCSDWYIFDNSKQKPRSLQNKTGFEKLSLNDQHRFTAHFLKGKFL